MYRAWTVAASLTNAWKKKKKKKKNQQKNANMISKRNLSSTKETLYVKVWSWYDFYLINAKTKSPL